MDVDLIIQISSHSICLYIYLYIYIYLQQQMCIISHSFVLCCMSLETHCVVFVVTKLYCAAGEQLTTKTFNSRLLTSTAFQRGFSSY